jgi:hypothetical protein
MKRYSSLWIEASDSSAASPGVSDLRKAEAVQKKILALLCGYLYKDKDAHEWTVSFDAQSSCEKKK